MTKEQLMKDIDERIETTWKMVDLFSKNRDAHGVMDMGAELQALQRAKAELDKVAGTRLANK
jgi:hypothetical protein